jgi:hypothetical protein
MASILVVQAALVPDIHPLWILPLLPRNTDFLGIEPVMRVSGWLVLPSFAVLLIPRLGPDARRSAPWLMVGAVALGAGILAMTVFTTIGFAGPATVARELVPGFVALRQARLNPLVPAHLETIVVPLNVISGGFKMGVLLWLWGGVAQAAWGLGRRWGVILGAAASTVASAWLLDPIRVDIGLYVLVARFAAPVLALVLVVSYVRGRRPWAFS